MFKMCWLASMDQLLLDQLPALWDVSRSKAGCPHWYQSLVCNLHSDRIPVRTILFSLFLVCRHLFRVKSRK